MKIVGRPIIVCVTIAPGHSGRSGSLVLLFWMQAYLTPHLRFDRAGIRQDLGRGTDHSLSQAVMRIAEDGRNLRRSGSAICTVMI